MTQGEKVRQIRKFLGFTMEKFGGRLGVTKTAISLIESGKNNLTDANIKSICREFNVNEAWLRTGEGEMFQDVLPDDEVAAAVSEVLEDVDCENAMYTLIKEFLITYQKSDENTKNAVNLYLSNVLDGYRKRKEDN